MPRADRLFALVQLLTGPSRRTLRELTEKLDTSARSIYRDLADLEERGVAIDRSGGGYRLLDGAALPTSPLTARERVLLTLALQNPDLESQPAFRMPIRALRSKLSRKTGGTFALSGPDRSGAVPEAVTASLEQAIECMHSVSLLYTSLTGGQRTWRGVDPWLLSHRSEAWYLIGRCHVHDEPRTFRLDRISAVLPIGRSFARPLEFDPQTWFAASWGIEAGSGPLHEVHVVFDAGVAPLIEFGRHHPSEEKNRRPDGAIDYRLRLGRLGEIARWIVGFGGAAVVLEPPELVDQVRAIAEGAAAAHRRRVLRSARRVTLPKKD